MTLGGAAAVKEPGDDDVFFPTQNQEQKITGLRQGTYPQCTQ